MALRLLIFFAGCLLISPALARPAGVSFPDSQIEPVAWSDIDGWAADDHAAAFKTFVASCRAIVRAPRWKRDSRPMFGALRDTCREALHRGNLAEEAARQFFEENFRPLRIAKLGETNGFLTGYYEPIVDGSRFPGPEFATPLYRPPPDLVSAVPVKRGQVFPNKGVVGRRNGKTIEPHSDRAEIEDGALDGKHLEICWLKDPADAFFIQIQGSARVRLEDGTLLRVNYAAHNGYAYTPIGRILIDRGYIPRDQMSMEKIREWMAKHPQEAQEVRRMNRSYVFFRIVGLSGDDEAIGAQGIPLTAGRSIAVDKALHVYGTPFFIESELPAPVGKFDRLMIGQDTGSAIVGPARADVYFGAGDDAGRMAGDLRHNGRFTMLVPNVLDPVVAARTMPLPLPRPVATEPAKPEAVPGKHRRHFRHRVRHR